MPCQYSALLTGVGSLATGFAGSLGTVDSGPWTCDGTTCSVSGLTFTFLGGGGIGLGGGYSITGDAVLVQ